jgi:alanine-glyoxylate transaminase/serine-glyoxylate transaminase/serine-pyruvate transaminase
MEAALVNLAEPGDAVLVAVCGYFGARLSDVAARAGARVIAVPHEPGRPADLARLKQAAAGERVRIVAAVHAETSTGVRQDLVPLAELAREQGALFVVDAVTSLGCMPVAADALGIDAAYSCSQKGLSCVPGLSPITFSERARARIAERKRPVQSLYLDLPLLMRFWGGERGYHHTVSSNLLVALHEALRLVHAEGLEARFARHVAIGDALRAGVRALGLELFVPDADALRQVTAIRVPDGVDDLRVRRRLLGEYGIEISGGLGAEKGRIWRVGTMGGGASRRNVVLVLEALAAALRAEGVRSKPSGAEAAVEALARAGS